MSLTTSEQPALPLWTEVPGPPRTCSRPWLGAAGSTLAAIVIGPFGPFYRTLWIAPAPAPVVVAVVGLAALLVIARTPERSWLPRLTAVAVAAGVSAPFGGVSVGIWMGMSLVLAGWVVYDRVPLPNRTRLPLPVTTHGAWGPAIALALVASWRGRSVMANVAPLILVSLSYVAVLIAASHPATMARAGARLSEAVRRVVQVILLTPLWAVVILVPWTAQRIFRIDPLRAPVGPVGTVRRSLAVDRPTRLWSSEAAADRLPLGERVRRKLVIPVVLLVALGAFVYERSQGPSDPPIPAAMADSPWWPEWRDAMRWYEYDGFSPLRFRRNLDIESPHVNVRDGKRATWQSPACDCPRLQAWIYGGSTTFGFGQRDEHTIASELARLALADGITLDVDNRGVAGDTHWMEAVRFGWDAEAEDAPDLAIFYDGGNDIGVGLRLNEEGRADEPQPLDPAIEDLRVSTEGIQGLFSKLDGVSKPDDVEVVEAPEGDQLTDEELGEAIARRYVRSQGVSRAVGERLDVPIFWYWQPSLATRTPVPEEPEIDASHGVVTEAVLDSLPDEVVDLTASLDENREPIFYDELHHNELGARLVAEAIYADLRPQLLELARQAEGGS